jgi:hypothetical protein
MRIAGPGGQLAGYALNRGVMEAPPCRQTFDRFPVLFGDPVNTIMAQGSVSRRANGRLSWGDGDSGRPCSFIIKGSL